MTHFTDGAQRRPYFFPVSHLTAALRSPSAVLTFRHTFRLVPAAILLVGCGGADLVLPGDGEPAAIEIVQGNEQSGRVGVVLAQPVVAR